MGLYEKIPRLVKKLIIPRELSIPLILIGSIIFGMRTYEEKKRKNNGEYGGYR